jgi:hypothetical protein
MFPMTFAPDITVDIPASRDNLPAYLDWIWQTYFSDVLRINDVTIEYCGPWKSRLGLIRLSLDASKTFIGINSLLRSYLVPESVVLTTIAHELVHYTHGFGSPLPRRWKHPHANHVVDHELEQRNLGSCLHSCNEWIDAHWYSFYAAQRSATRSYLADIV